MKSSNIDTELAALAKKKRRVSLSLYLKVLTNISVILALNCCLTTIFWMIIFIMRCQEGWVVLGLSNTSNYITMTCVIYLRELGIVIVVWTILFPHFACTVVCFTHITSLWYLSVRVSSVHFAGVCRRRVPVPIRWHFPDHNIIPCQIRCVL